MNMEAYHNLLKGDEWTRFDDFETDQQLDKPRPDVQKPYPEDAALIDLVSPEDFSVGQRPVLETLGDRESHRLFAPEALSLEELSFLLWATQGISKRIMSEGITYYKRNVPSGGNRHPFETYLSIHKVEGLDVGLYRYLPLDHKLLIVNNDPEIAIKTSKGGLDQTSQYQGQAYYFLREAAVLFIWTVIPYRTEWRYGPAGPKLAAIDAGHVCQNLYTACGAIGAGTCAVGAFDRKEMDAVIGVDGEEEFSFYLAPVGKLASKGK